MRPSPKLLNALTAFADGLDAGRMSRLTPSATFDNRTMPINFSDEASRRLISTPITVADIVRYGVYFANLSIATAAVAEARGEDPDLGVVTGSNAWLVGTGASSSGNILALTDPHVGIESLSFRSYFAQVDSPGYKFSGWAPVGFPFFAGGFSDAISMGPTANIARPFQVWSADTAADGLSYMLDGVSTPITRCTVNIEYWDGTPTTPTSTYPTMPVDIAWAIRTRAVVRRRFATPSCSKNPWKVGFTTLEARSAKRARSGEFLWELQNANDVGEAETAFLNGPGPVSQNLLISDTAGGMSTLTPRPPRIGRASRPLRRTGTTSRMATRARSIGPDSQRQ